MSRQEGTYKLGSNMEPKVNAPVDARLVVPTKSDLYAFQYFYRGMVVYVHDTGEYYELVNDLPQYEASWKPHAAGGEFNLIEMSDAEIDALFA